MEKSDKIMLAMLQDKINQCYDYGIPVNTGFLDSRQRTLAENCCKKMKGLHYEFQGGYEEAERCVCIVYPDDQMEHCPLAVLKVKKTGPKELSHRDYMGSILSLGIKRELIGDILIQPYGADIVILMDLGDYFVSNFDRAGSVALKVEVSSIKDLVPVDGRFEETRETLSSLRLDNVVSAAFKISRSSASDAINGGLVYINGQQVTKLDKLLVQGDKVVLRGKGKIIMQDLLDNNRKGKRVVVIKKYI